MSIFIIKGIPNHIRYGYQLDWDKHNTCLLPIHEETVHILSVEAFQNWIKEWPTYSDPKYKLSWLWNTKFKEFNYNRGVDEDAENQENQDKPVNNLCFARLFWIVKHKCLCPYCGVHVDRHDLLYRHYVKLGLTPEFIVKELEMPLTVMETFVNTHRQQRILNVFICAGEYVFIHKECMSKIFKTNIRRF